MIFIVKNTYWKMWNKFLIIKKNVIVVKNILMSHFCVMDVKKEDIVERIARNQIGKIINQNVKHDLIIFTLILKLKLIWKVIYTLLFLHNFLFFITKFFLFKSIIFFYLILFLLKKCDFFFLEIFFYSKFFLFNNLFIYEI